MSLVDIGYRRLPNVYLDYVHLEEINNRIPKIRAFFVMKDFIINGRPFWAKNKDVVINSNIVISLEDSKGQTYFFKKISLSSILNNPQIKLDENGNTIHIYKFDRVIDQKQDYYMDKSLVFKTYVEQGKVTSSIMKKIVQNTNGSIPIKSFYFLITK